jgi:TNF receptor-associated protein 1
MLTRSHMLTRLSGAARTPALARYAARPSHGLRLAARGLSSTPPPAEEQQSAEAAAAAAAAAPLPPSEAATGEASRMEFQAETKKLLNIVANSLYTDKEVFVRELVSNASDALEKRRYQMLSGGTASDDGSAEMGITISTDKEANTLTIQDNGIGMSRDELVNNLGTIARSGTKSFAQQLNESKAGVPDGGAAANVIGQFGVGFYAVFMVADEVTVYSRRHDEEQAHCWTSTGDGAYSLSEASGVQPGTKIVLKLKPEEATYSSRFHIEQNIRKYSNFVGFPINVDGERVNTIDAIWTKSKNEVTEEQHGEFFRYVAQSFDDPRYTLHFNADSPISIRALFYVPQSHMEKWGMARQDVGVHLYSRKVLIQSRCEGLLPEWMRFFKGVVDSEDLPLNISRETMQDSALMRKLSTVLAKRAVKFLIERAKADSTAYLSFYKEFGQFIKEGVYTDFDNKNEVAKLLRFETSRGEPGELVSLDDYVGRMSATQNDEIYWLVAPTRDSALSSAYMEAFKSRGVEVLLLYSTVDEFVMTNLMNYGGKSLVSAEQAKLDLDTPASSSLSDEQFESVKAWLVEAVDGVKEVQLSTRLTDSPAIVVGHESASMRRMMAMVESGTAPTLPPQTLEINGAHPIITSLAKAKEADPALAKRVADQVFSNALVAAGLLDDPRTMLPNVNAILEEVLSKHKAAPTDAEAAAAKAE